MSRSIGPFLGSALAALALCASLPAAAAAEECQLTPRAGCFAVDSLAASLSSTQAGGHPDLGFSFDIAQDPQSEPNVFGLRDAYAPTRNVRIELPPGLIGDPNVIGESQQCTLQGLVSFNEPGGGCPNGSQVGLTRVHAYELTNTLTEPLYMMQPPGGDVVARMGFIAGVYPTLVDLRVRSEGDYGISAEITNASTAAKLIDAETTVWGVPADPSHDSERCTPDEVIDGCVSSAPRPPGSRPLPFLTNPTRCGVPLQISVNASSWVQPAFFAQNTKQASFPQISGCNKLPFGPSLSVEPTSRHTSAPSGLDMTIRLPRSDGVDVLEPAQLRDIRLALPEGIEINPGSGDGLATCSEAQVGYRENVASECPDAAKLAATEFEIAALPRRMKGAIYLREPEPGNPFRIWVLADDLGAHVKLPGHLDVDKASGQISSVLVDNPQVPLREVRLLFKSGFRAPLLTPPACGTYLTRYEFTPWSGGPPASGETPMQIDEGCNTAGFAPKLTAGSTDASAGAHAPFLFTISREDGEQNPQDLEVSLPTGLAATFAGIPRCEGAAAETGACPPDSRIGRVIAAIGAGPAPLWVPQPGKRPTAVYLSGPYRGAPLSIVAVVPKQAGPFDFGDEVTRSAVFVDPITARATAIADPLPQRIEGIPVDYRTIHVILDRPGFSLNPTNCAAKQTTATLTSAQAARATPSSPYAATNCASLPFKPRLSIAFKGSTRRTSHPRLLANLSARPGEANIARAQVKLPPSAFLDQGNIKAICTRVQFAADACPPGSVYGRASARTPLIDGPLSGPVYLRSSAHPLPDLVVKLRGPDSLPIEIDLVGKTDSVKGALRNTFEAVPDAPVSKFHLELFGGKGGLIELSGGLCKNPKAQVQLGGQNGKVHHTQPVVKTSCPKKHRESKHHKKAGAQR